MTSEVSNLSETEIEVMDLCIALAQFLGLPKSLGEIYGAVFIASLPVTMEDIMERHGMSKGSVSQGLRALKAMGAVRNQFIPNDRRDHYVAETGLGHLVSGILRSRYEPAIVDFGSRVASLAARRNRIGKNELHLVQRINKLKHWQEQAEHIVPTLRHVLGGDKHAE
ncbi:MAG: GbsR/MarR family transcriptional regulator [Candidatus Methylacidiphilales bacterium]